MSEQRRRWVHDNEPRGGYGHHDQYAVLVGSIVGPSGRWETAYEMSDTWHATVAQAIHEGFTKYDRADDFNIAVIRPGLNIGDGPSLVALLWMDEVVEERGHELHPIAEQVGLA